MDEEAACEYVDWDEVYKGVPQKEADAFLSGCDHKKKQIVEKLRSKKVQMWDLDLLVKWIEENL